MPLQSTFESMRPVNPISNAPNPHIVQAPGGIHNFLNQINQDIVQINLMIARYNQEDQADLKKNILTEIMEAKEIIDTKYPSSCMAYFADFTAEFDEHLFNQIQKQLAYFSAQSTASIITKRTPPLPSLIEQMRPEKLVELMQILQQGSQYNLDKLKALYDPSDKEFNDYQAFLGTYTVAYLGGGNSKNFSFIPLSKRNKPFVLKIENRLDQPGMAERHLRTSSLQAIMTPIEAKRQATFTYQTPRVKGYSVEPYDFTKQMLANTIYVIINSDRITYSYLDAYNTVQTDAIDLTRPEFSALKSINPSNLKSSLPALLAVTAARSQTPADTFTVNRALLVTDFCEGGDLETYALSKTTSQERVNSAVNIFRQMSSILLKISADHCAFPDMKNINWLIDKQGNIQLADTKSFVFTDDAGLLDTKIAKNIWAGVTQTPYVSPPEINPYNENTPCAADSMHAYMLGKNLYQCLTHCDYRYLKQCTDATAFSFTDDVFQSPEGALFKDLIESLVKQDPHQRLSVSDTLVSLNKIQVAVIKRTVDEYRASLTLCGVDHDTALITLLDTLQQSQDVETLLSLQNQLHLQLIPLLQAHCIRILNKSEINPMMATFRADKINQTTDFNLLKSMQQHFEQELVAHLTIKCNNTNLAISKAAFGLQDTPMQLFFADQQKLISQTQDSGGLETLYQNLTVILAEQKSPSMTSLKEMLALLRKKNLYYMGGSNKANQIEQAINKVPFDQRINMNQTDSENPAILEVQRLLKKNCPPTWSKTYFKQALPSADTNIHSVTSFRERLPKPEADEKFNPMHPPLD